MPWLMLAVPAALACGLIAFTLGAVTRERRASTWRQVVTAALLWGWGAWIVVMTLTPRRRASNLNLDPLDLTNRIDVIDFGLNMLVFAPIGILLALRGANLGVALLAGFAGSLAIEATQFVLATGRTTDVNDLVSNTVGCLLGFAATAGIRAASRRRMPTPA